MSQIPHHFISVPCGSVTRAGFSADRCDDLGCSDALRGVGSFYRQEKIGRFRTRRNFFYDGVGPKRYPPGLHLHRQEVRHVPGGFGVGVHEAGIQRPNCNTPFLQKLHRLPAVLRFFVGNIASSVARGADFPPRPVVLLHYQDSSRRIHLRRLQGRCHAGCAGADNANVK